MPRYWVIAPSDSLPSEDFDRVWQYDLANNVISIGWKNRGNVSTVSRQELGQAISLAYPDKRAKTPFL